MPVRRGSRRTAPPHPAWPPSLVRQSRPRVERKESRLRRPGLEGPTAAGVVLVDVWDRHYIKEPEARAEKIIQEKIRPLLAARRPGGDLRAGPPQAKSEPGWIGRAEKRDSAECAPQADASWPPSEFRKKTGPYRQFARPAEPMEPARLQRVKGLCIHPEVRPLPGEAVIATGDELHRYCRQKGILFLFYVGFNTNACILFATTARSK